MPDFSCTDVKCYWKYQTRKSLEKYDPIPLKEHSSFKMQENEFPIDEMTEKRFRELVMEKLPGSAFAKHVLGRHEPIIMQSQEKFELSEEVRAAIRQVFMNQSESDLHILIRHFLVAPLDPCCVNVYDSIFIEDPVTICEETFMNDKNWKKANNW